jgi:hypothetical protein
MQHAYALGIWLSKCDFMKETMNRTDLSHSCALIIEGIGVTLEVWYSVTFIFRCRSMCDEWRIENQMQMFNKEIISSVKSYYVEDMQSRLRSWKKIIHVTWLLLTDHIMNNKRLKEHKHWWMLQIILMFKFMIKWRGLKSERINSHMIWPEHVRVVQILLHAKEWRKYIQVGYVFHICSNLISQHRDHMKLSKIQGYDSSNDKPFCSSSVEDPQQWMLHLQWEASP